MMTSEAPAVRDTDLLPVTRACEALGVCRTTLARYERNGWIDSVVGRTGRKLYRGSEIKRLFRTVSNF